MNITKVLNIPISGHAKINFIDIDNYTDTKLYIDPYVIVASTDSFCEEAKLAINSFLWKYLLRVKWVINLA